MTLHAIYVYMPVIVIPNPAAANHTTKSRTKEKRDGMDKRRINIDSISISYLGDQEGYISYQH